LSRLNVENVVKDPRNPVPMANLHSSERMGLSKDHPESHPNRNEPNRLTINVPIGICWILGSWLIAYLEIAPIAANSPIRIRLRIMCYWSWIAVCCHWSTVMCLSFIGPSPVVVISNNIKEATWAIRDRKGNTRGSLWWK
jgi:hypothetical protein